MSGPEQHIGVDGAEVLVATARGEGCWLLDRPAATSPSAWLLLGHGAGGGPNAADLLQLAHGLPQVGVAVARFEQPWRRAGRRVAPRPVVLDEAWLEAFEALAEFLAGAAVIVGGRSAGARVACRTASGLGAVAVVNLSFPLHLPGHPERSRLDELLLVPTPTLTLQGERDSFGTAAELTAALAAAGEGTRHRVCPVPGAGHDLRIPARHPERERARALVLTSVVDFLAELDLVDGTPERPLP